MQVFVHQRSRRTELQGTDIGVKLDHAHICKGRQSPLKIKNIDMIRMSAPEKPS